MSNPLTDEQIITRLQALAASAEGRASVRTLAHMEGSALAWWRRVEEALAWVESLPAEQARLCRVEGMLQRGVGRAYRRAHKADATAVSVGRRGVSVDRMRCDDGADHVTVRVEGRAGCEDWRRLDAPRGIRRF